MRKQRKTFVFAVVVTIALLAFVGVQRVNAAGETCSATQKCPKSSPCCSYSGKCGGGALQCAGGCQAWASYTPESCVANPICQNKNLTFTPNDYNNPYKFWPVLLYNGNASSAPFTLDYGSLGQGPQGVLLQLTQQSQTRISTTDYMLYGSVELTARHSALTGLVFAFITMSDTKDEIDWEFTTNDVNDMQTNYFSQGVIAKGTAADVDQKSFSVEDFHTYGINWQPNQLQWIVDGKVVRTVSRATAGSNYPRSPSRVQASVWAGGNSTNPPGVIEWSGGAIDWTSSEYTQAGYYSVEITSFQQTCASQSAANLTTQGTGTAGVTSWKYTGGQSASLGMPEFVLSTDPLSFIDNPGLNGIAGLPGYGEQTPFTKSNKNAWDGSGDTSNLPKSVVDGSTTDNSGSSSSSNSGGWLANNRTLSIAVPVVGAIIVVALLWGLAVCSWRKMRRNSGVMSKSEGDDDHVLYGAGASVSSHANGAVSSKQMTSYGNAAPATTKGPAPATGGRSSNYHALHDEDEDLEEDEHSLARGAAPMGAQKIGKGYGPASGPRPGREYYTSSTSSHQSTTYDGSYDDAASGRGQRAYTYQQQPAVPMRNIRSPVPQQIATPPPRRTPMATPSVPQSNYAVRGPYTPGMNAYTPGVQETPAMRGVFASPYPGAQSFQSPSVHQYFQSSPQRNPYAQQQPQPQPQPQPRRYGGY